MSSGTVGAPDHDSNGADSNGPDSNGPDWRSSPRLAAVWQELAPLAARFAEAGHRLYLVGGTVRDLVAGDEREEFDLDATTTAVPAEIKGLLQGWADAIWTQGERFGTIGATKRTGAGADRVFEITTHRAEAYRGDSRKPEVRFSDDVVADLSRRDFTVNAMAIEVTAGEPVLVDPFDGAGDMARLVLRTPLTPAESFSDDPLRMLRAARFVTRYGLVPEPELVDAVRSMSGRMSIVSAERIRDELDKLVRCAAPAAGLRFVLDTGLAGEVLPELTGRAIEVVAAIEVARRTARWAALFDAVDARAARARMRALRASTADVDDVGRLVGARDRWFGADRGDPAGDAIGDSGADASADRWTDAALRRLVHDVGRALDDLLALVEARATTEPEGPAGSGVSREVGAVRQRIAHWSTTGDLASLEPELDGAQVMEVLGLAPGREVGQALAFLQELRLEEGVLGPDAAADRLRKWWTDHPK